MSLIRMIGIACMILTVAVATLDAASTGKFTAMTIGQFLSAMDGAAVAFIQRTFAASANASMVLQFVFSLPAAVVFVFLAVGCLWFAHRRDTSSDNMRLFIP